MLNIIITVLFATLICCLFMVALWKIQEKTKEADIVDFGWTVCLGFLAVFYSILARQNALASSLVAIFAAVWSFRLGAHLWRRVNSPGEDGRYISLRQSWGSNASRNFFIFFQAQAVLAVFLSLTFLVPVAEKSELYNWQLLAAVSWFVFCIAGEALADYQLQKWRDNPANKGKTCRQGLWNYSRHPNYFFEWLYWFSYTILALNSDYWYLTLISPLVLLYSILKVTGIPPTEARALLSRGDDYREYQKTTSAFIPFFRRTNNKSV